VQHAIFAFQEDINIEKIAQIRESRQSAILRDDKLGAKLRSGPFNLQL
jgi:hypothetical protein